MNAVKNRFPPHLTVQMARAVADVEGSLVKCLDVLPHVVEAAPSTALEVTEAVESISQFYVLLQRRLLLCTAHLNDKDFLHHLKLGGTNLSSLKSSITRIRFGISDPVLRRKLIPCLKTIESYYVEKDKMLRVGSEYRDPSSRVRLFL